MRTFALIAAFFCAAAGLRAESTITKISLERTACFGTCPVYKLSVYRSGRVEFDGKEHVQEKGRRSGRISAADFARLVGKIEEINFFGLNDRYHANVTDLPTTTTSVTRGNRTKTVEDYFAGPAGLKEFEDLIDEVAKSSIWIRGKP